MTASRLPLAALLALAAPGFLAPLSGCRRPAPPPRAAAPAPVPEEPAVPIVEPPPQRTTPPQETALVYTVVTDDAGSRLKAETIPVGKKGAPEETARALIDAMAARKDSPLPKGTHALSVAFAGELATVDLSRQFKSNFSGGDENEALAINAVLATLGQFPGVRRVQILIDGARIDSLGGTQSLDQPLQIPQEPPGAGSAP